MIDDPERKDDIIISYLASDDDSFLKNKLIRKSIIALILSIVTLIIFVINYRELISIPFGIMLFLFVIIIPLSFVTEQIKRKVIQLALSLILQVVVPTILVFPFEHFYGILTLSTFVLSMIFLFFDIVFVKSIKS